MSYYHYTKGFNLTSIVKDGIIKTSKTLIEKKEKPAVWLSKSPEWEKSCNIGKIVSQVEFIPGRVYSSNEIDSVPVSDDYMKKEVGMCRILVSETLQTITWAKYKYVSGISEGAYSAIDSYSRSIGCPIDKWICSFNPIPKKYWEGIEMYVDDQWVRCNEKISIDEFIDLCLGCNGKEESEDLGVKKEHPDFVYRQLGFIIEYAKEIIAFWEANKHRKGYIEIYVTPDYEPYKCGFRFIEKRIQKSSFRKFKESPSDNYALVKFLWEATYTKYRMALSYEYAMMPI